MASKPWLNKRGEWEMKWRPDPKGPWVKVTLGKHPTPLKGAKPSKQVPQFVEERRREFADMEYRAKHGLSAPTPKARSITAYVDEYLSAYAIKRPANSVKATTSAAMNFVRFIDGLGITAMQAVTKDHCMKYMEHRLRTVSVQTVKAESGHISPIWSRALDAGIVPANPWFRLKVPGKVPDPSPTFWSAEDIAKIAEAAGHPWVKDLILVLANTGIRISATLAMEWDWVDWSGAGGKGSIRVPAKHDKGGVGYAQTMEQGARSILERRHILSKHDLVFAHWAKGGPIVYKTARNAICRAIKKAGVAEGTPHDFRHSYGRLLERAGVPMSVIQRQLGHRSAAMTVRYTSASEDETAKWCGQLDVGRPPDPKTSA